MLDAIRDHHAASGPCASIAGIGGWNVDAACVAVVAAVDQERLIRYNVVCHLDISPKIHIYAWIEWIGWIEWIQR